MKEEGNQEAKPAPKQVSLSAMFGWKSKGLEQEATPKKNPVGRPRKPKEDAMKNKKEDKNRGGRPRKPEEEKRRHNIKAGEARRRRAVGAYAGLNIIKNLRDKRALDQEIEGSESRRVSSAASSNSVGVISFLLIRFARSIASSFLYSSGVIVKFVTTV